MTEAEAMQLLNRIERETHYMSPVVATEAEIAVAQAERQQIRSERHALTSLQKIGLKVERPMGRNMWIVRLRCHRVFDFWPTTGRWRERDVQLNRAGMAWNRPARQEGQGIEGLLAAIGDAR